MTGIEQTVAGAMKWAAKRGYEHYTTRRLERALARASQAGVSVSDLCKTEHRFALFVRMVRAMEVASQSEVVDYIADAMIGTVHSGDVDSKPDLAQMAISSVAGLTKLELDIILLMRKHQLWGRTDEETKDETGFAGFYPEVQKSLGLDDLTATAVLNSLTKTGLVTPPATGVANSLMVHGNKLTGLAYELFCYVDYAKRLTG